MSAEFDAWTERVVADRESRPLEAGEVLEVPAARPFAPAISLARTEARHFIGEVGRRENDLVFHFFPADGPTFVPGFEDKLTESFVTVFKFLDRIQAAKVDVQINEEVNAGESWSVLALGYGDNFMAEDLAIRLFHTLDVALG
jgi:hypothetical protein